MVDLETLLRYLSSGPCIAWVGTGPSINMGLKGWKPLANSFLELARREKKSNFQSLEQYYQTNKYPSFFGEIIRGYGEEYLIANCREQLVEPEGEGGLYSAIMQLPFISYFTTNWDNLLYKHALKKKAWKLYQNDRASLGSIEINTIPSIVKLHGSLEEGYEKTLIITDDQYRLWYEQGEKQYFRDFIAAHLLTQRIVFIGYSLNDPEILQLQKRLQENLRRKIPAMAILANVSDTDLDYWKREYNIEIIRYFKQGEDHSELTDLLNTAARFLGDIRQPITITTQEAKLAQKFYMWHRFEQSGEKDRKIDALKSVVLMTVNEFEGQVFGCEKLRDTLKDYLNISEDKLLEHISKCCEKLSEEGWLVRKGNNYCLDAATKELIESYNRRYEDLVETFVRQAKLDLSRMARGYDEDVIEKAANLVLEIISDIFEVRGIEIVNLAFSNTPVAITGANDILATIWSKAQKAGDNIGFIITNFIIDLLTKPSGVAEQLIDYLSKAFVSMQALRIGVGEEELLSEFFKNQAYIIDENVLIPLIADGEPRNELCLNVVTAAVEKGVFLFTTDFSVHEVFWHAVWAKDLVARYGEQSKEVMNAAMGWGEYTTNAFLSGYILGAKNHPITHDFNEYLMQCVGGGLNERKIWDRLSSMGIARLSKEKAREGSGEAKEINETIRVFIENDVTWKQLSKSAERIQREADAYTIIYRWGEYSKIFSQQHRPYCGFLTLATSLLGVAKNGPLPINRSFLASPQNLYELIIRYLGEKEKEVDIGSVLRSSYFRTAGQFIDREKYTEFFTPLISEFYKTYREHFELYRKYIENELTKGVIDEYEPLDRVDFVSSLENKLESMPTKLIQENKELMEKLSSLEKRLQITEDRERRRKEYIARQKNQSKKKKQQ